MSRRLIAALGALAILSESAALIALGAILSDPEPSQARLIGLGCKDAAGPLYAREESEFPQCRTIRPNGESGK